MLPSSHSFKKKWSKEYQAGSLMNKKPKNKDNYNIHDASSITIPNYNINDASSITIPNNYHPRTNAFSSFIFRIKLCNPRISSEAKRNK